MARADEILDYWFGPLDDRGAPASERERFWFVPDSKTDEEIRSRFASDVIAAAAGDYSDWRMSPQRRLALILLLDQFPRNIYRGTPKAFMHDALAHGLTEEGLALTQDHDLHPFERVFFYLPLEHAEDIAAQEQSVRLFTVLVQESAPPLVDRLRVFLDYAIRHRDIIRRFGRFPHRNAVLNRASTPEELAFLQTPGSSF